MIKKIAVFQNDIKKYELIEKEQAVKMEEINQKILKQQEKIYNHMIEFLQLKNDDLIKENLELRRKIHIVEYEYRIKI